MQRPDRQPIGLNLARTAKSVGHAFDAALAAAGGSLPIWRILIALKTRRPGSQRELASAADIEGATLTHHLNALEADGLLVRRRDPANRRLHLVELTDRGEAMFHRLRAAALAFDQRLRAGLADEDIARLEELLGRLRRNVAEGETD